MTTLIGREVAVTACSHAPLTGLRGTAVDETKHTVTIRTDTDVTVLKHTATFTVDGTPVDGTELLERPEDRV